MIRIDYSILLSLQLEVKAVKPTETDFLVQLDRVNQQTPDPREMLFRSNGSKNFLLTSEEFAILEEVNEGTPVVRRRLAVKGLHKALSCTFLAYLQSPRLERFIGWPRNNSGLPGLQVYPFLKPIYFINDQRLDQNSPIDKGDLIGLAPVFLRFPKTAGISIRKIDTHNLISPTNTDDHYDQYDLSTSTPGIYAIEAPDSAQQKMYVNPLLGDRQPLAVFQLDIPSGAFTRKDYTIAFKNKL